MISNIFKIKSSDKKLINTSSSLSSIYTSPHVRPAATPASDPQPTQLWAMMLAPPVGGLIPTKLLMANSLSFNSKPQFLSLRKKLTLFR